MKKEKINKIFHSIADKYDLMNDLMSFGLHRLWKKKFVDMIDLSFKKKIFILDLGSGTGDIVSQINKKYKQNSNYLSFLVDPSTEMIKEGTKKLKGKNIIWVASYGEKLPFKSNKFDLVTMSFSLRNVENIKITLNEVKRVLKKNGQFLCLEFGKIKNLAINSIYKTYSDNFIPALGKNITGNKEAYEYLVESIKKFPPQEKILRILKLKKFHDIDFYNLNFGVAVIYSCRKK